MKAFLYPIAITTAIFSSGGMCSSYHAQQDSSAYLSAEVGQSDIDTTGFDEGTYLSGLFGWRANQHFGIELSYSDLGESESSIGDSEFADLVSEKFHGETLEFTGTTFDVSLVFIWPVSGNFNLFAKVGYAFWDAELNTKGFGEEASFNGEDPVYGVGAEYQFNPSWSATLNWKRYSFTDSGDDLVEIDGDVDAISAGIKYSF